MDDRAFLPSSTFPFAMTLVVSHLMEPALFAISDDLKSFKSSDGVYERWGGVVLDGVVELVKCECWQGRPLPVVERTAGSGQGGSGMLLRVRSKVDAFSLDRCFE